MKFKIIVLLVLLSFDLCAQKSADVDFEPQTLPKDVQFTHVPFLLLRFNPSTLFGINNTWQVGAELAPPFGKFSFAFDYGKGKGSSNFNKFIKNNMAETKNLEYRGELKMYFSDWFPFYALDKKPFGRYYSIEYINAEYDRDLPAFIAKGGDLLPSYFELDNIRVVEKNQRLHLKLGKHFHLHKHLFIDVFIGAGIGKYSTSEGEFEENSSDDEFAHFAFLTNKKFKNPGETGLYFSKTGGLRIVVPL